MPFNHYESSTWKRKHEKAAPPIKSSIVRRKLFFRNYQVLRAKNRVYGKNLPPHQVLVKLRKPGGSPTWVRIARNAFDREKCFRDIRNRL